MVNLLKTKPSESHFTTESPSVSPFFVEPLQGLMARLTRITFKDPVRTAQ
jgi:hypothetical protein